MKLDLPGSSVLIATIVFCVILFFGYTLLTTTAHHHNLFALLGITLAAFLSARGIALSIRQSAYELQAHRQFIANASHELRTPLSVMKSMTEVALLDKELLPKEAQDILISNLEEIDRMSGIIRDLLLISQSQSVARPKNPLSMSTVNLTSLLKEVLQKMSVFSDKKSITITPRLQESIRIRGHKKSIAEMATNLLRNAITHTPARGVISVSISQTIHTGAVLRIQDTGTGIPKEELAHIFEPFYRGSNSTVNRGGSGLGLSIVKGIVDQHHGSIRLTSTVGKGTTAHVRFPSLS